MSHCDPISHGTANSARREKKNKQRVQRQKINKERRRKNGGRKRQQTREKIKLRAMDEKELLGGGGSAE